MAGRLTVLSRENSPEGFWKAEGLDNANRKPHSLYQQAGIQFAIPVLNLTRSISLATPQASVSRQIHLPRKVRRNLSGTAHVRAQTATIGSARPWIGKLLKKEGRSFWQIGLNMLSHPGLQTGRHNFSAARVRRSHPSSCPVSSACRRLAAFFPALVDAWRRCFGFLRSETPSETPDLPHKQTPDSLVRHDCFWWLAVHIVRKLRPKRYQDRKTDIRKDLDAKKPGFAEKPGFRTERTRGEVQLLLDAALDFRLLGVFLHLLVFLVVLLIIVSLTHDGLPVFSVESSADLFDGNRLRRQTTALHDLRRISHDAGREMLVLPKIVILVSCHET